ncbi:hypothetical protein WME75_28600 [Sorangium sp. So ce1014]|uniref:hypothetical protein n=1 Tax=Sorangium sp. So ce1014 TaxID=3133326 RepID=UPI003F63376A
MFLCCPRAVALLAIPLVTTACIGAELDAELDEEAAEPIGEAEGAIVSSNSMLPNAMSKNALSSSALNPAALSPNPLTWAGLSANARAALQNPGSNGALSRELLRYVVSCALRPNQSFSFSWNDGGTVRSETYRGDLAIADWWVYGPLADPFYQRWMSGCLASRTNWYGVSVLISLRSSQPFMSSGTTERNSYTVREGAFWGNLFSSTPYLRACYSPAGVARARTLQRDCAAGHLDVNPGTGASTTQACGPIAIVGSCDTVCSGVSNNGGFYSQCLENPAISSTVRTDQVVTSFLPP